MARVKQPGDDAAAYELERMADRIRVDIEQQGWYASPPWPAGMSEEAIESTKSAASARIVGMRWCERMLRNRATRLRNGTARR